MRPNKKVPAIALVVVVVLTGFFLWRNFYQPAFHYAGTVEATRIDLPARVPTVVEDIMVEEGQRVGKGELLAVLSCEEIKIAQKLATENYERALKLQRTGSISKENFELVHNRKQEADIKLSWCEIKSPVAGTVLTRFLEPQEWVNPGTKVLSVADLDNLWSYVYVPQEVMARLKLGTGVWGIIPELGQRKIPGVISKINNEAEFTPKNVQTQAERTRLVFGVKIAFKNTDQLLKPGMTIETDLEMHGIRN